MGEIKSVCEAPTETGGAESGGREELQNPFRLPFSDPEVFPPPKVSGTEGSTDVPGGAWRGHWWRLAQRRPQKQKGNLGQVATVPKRFKVAPRPSYEVEKAEPCRTAKGLQSCPWDRGEESGQRAPFPCSPPHRFHFLSSLAPSLFHAIVKGGCRQDQICAQRGT